MKTFSEARKIYNSIEIPDELENVVKDAIERGKEEKRRATAHVPTRAIMRGSLAACAVLVLAIALNFITPFLSPEVSDTAREDAVNMPKMMRTVQDFGINETLRDEAISERVERAKAHYGELVLKSFKDADLNAKNIEITADCHISYESADILSFIVTVKDEKHSLTPREYYYNIRLSNASDITLRDFLGDNYEQKMKFAQNAATPQNAPLKDGDGTESASSEEAFYINERGNAVIVNAALGEKYEIEK